MATTQSISHKCKSTGQAVVVLQPPEKEMTLRLMATYDAAPTCNQSINCDWLIKKSNATSYYLKLDPFKEYIRKEEIMENASQLWFELEKLHKATY